MSAPDLYPLDHAKANTGTGGLPCSGLFLLQAKAQTDLDLTKVSKVLDLCTARSHSEK